MKSISKLTAAVAAVCAAGAAQAYDPATTATDYRVVIAGATATTNTLRDVILRDVCASNRDLYRFPASTVRYTIACRTTANKNVLFMKNDGGSGTGVSPVDQKIAVSVLETPSNSVCGAGSAVTSPFGTSYTEHSCDPTNAALLGNRIPDFGLSDIEPSKFVGALAPAEGAFRNVSNMKVSSTAGLAFGIVVNTNLYRALQKAQFADSDPCSPVPTVDLNGNGVKDAYEVNATDSSAPLTVPASGQTANHKKGDTEACMPSLSTAQVRSLLMDSGLGITTWDEFKAKGSTLVALNAAYGWAPADSTKILCRRTSGSGTHALTSIKFLQTQCGAGATAGGQLMASGSNFATDCGSTVCDATLENSGSSGLIACVNQANTEGFWAIGYASLESNSRLTSNARFIKIDGAAPNLKNLVAGKYPIFGEVTAQSRQQDNAADYTVANVPAAERTNAKNNWATIVAELSSAANVVALNASDTFRHPFGDSGFLARGVPTSFTYNSSSPIATQTHANPNSGGAQNTCFGPIAVDGVNVQ